MNNEPGDHRRNCEKRKLSPFQSANEQVPVKREKPTDDKAEKDENFKYFVNRHVLPLYSYIYKNCYEKNV